MKLLNNLNEPPLNIAYILSAVKAQWHDRTDIGPGVGVSKNKVKFRDTEMCRSFKSDYRINIQRACENS